MRRIAQTQLEDGWWEKTEQGYRLVAKSSSSAKELADKKAQDKAMATVAKAWSDFAKFHPLGVNERLLARLSVDERRAKLPDMLARLNAVTGLKFTLADNLSHHDPVLGDFQLKNTRAFSIMEFIAKNDIDNGRWEKTEDGYRPEGGSHTPLPVRPKTFNWLWLVLALAVTFTAVGGIAILIYRRGSKKAAANAPHP